METMDAYLHRKHEELRLLDDCLGTSLASARPQSVDEVIALKFKLTAALRAQHDLRDWTTTETAWSHGTKSSDSPFDFRYDYQRADLEVAGPSFYDLGDDFNLETIYTSSGMASISSLLLALSHIFHRANIVVLPGTYGETLEFLESYARHWKTIKAGKAVLCEPTSSPSHQILLLDSCALAEEFGACLRSSWSQFDLCIFDTTCFYAGSGRVRRALQRARKEGVPMVMVRSHTKLDSLGAEYGRLGSTTFVRYGNDGIPFQLEKLPQEVRNAVRLLGSAALPAHFPPYVGNEAYRSLSAKRVAAILRNGRRTARYFRKNLGNLTAESQFVHGVYLTLKCSQPMDERAAREAASKMSDDISRAGFPMRHAGSFGFDFAATEWCRDILSGGFGVRIAVPDIPTAIWDEQSGAIARWWSEHDCSRFP